MQHFCISRLALIVSLLAVCVSAGAQRNSTPVHPAPAPQFQLTDNRTGPTDEVITEVLPIRHGRAEELLPLLERFTRDQAQFTLQTNLGVLVVTGTQEDANRVRGALAMLDVPTKNLELTVYVLRGGYGQQDKPLPAVLDPVVGRLLDDAPYTRYSIADTLLLRTRPGQEAATSDVALLDDLRLSQTVQARVSLAENEGERVVGIDQIRYQASALVPVGPPPSAGTTHAVPVSMATQEVSFSASLDVPEGRSALAGKVNLGQENSDLFVVVVARVVETD